MISQGALEEAVLSLLCFNRETAPLLALKVDPSIFTSRTNQLIAKTALQFIQRFQTPPGGQLEYLLETEMRRGEEGRLLAQTLDILTKQSQDVDAAFVLEELDRFIQIQKLQTGLQEAMESLARGELERAREVVYQTSSETVEAESEGVWITDARRMFQFMDEADDEYFSSGVPAMDRAKARPARKTLTFMMAAAKKGKSWWLHEVGKSGLQFHKKVLHITLENSQKIAAKRYLQSIFALTSTEAKEIRVPIFTDSETQGISIDFRNITRSSLMERRKDIEQRLAAITGRLLIKEFPTGTLSTEHLALYLDSLKRKEGFVPDLVLIDYADLMKIDATMLRIDTGRLYRELRGIGVMGNYAMVTATQGNRESDEARVVDRKNVSEDWSKIGTADLVFTYSQTAEEKRLGLARMLCAAGRDSADRFMVLISQCYEIGQFCLDSAFMTSEVSDQVSQLMEGANA